MKVGLTMMTDSPASSVVYGYVSGTTGIEFCYEIVKVESKECLRHITILETLGPAIRCWMKATTLCLCWLALSRD